MNFDARTTETAIETQTVEAATNVEVAIQKELTLADLYEMGFH